MECKKGTGRVQKDAAQGQASEWLDDAYVEAAIAVCYPANLVADLDEMANCDAYEFTAIQPDGAPTGWTRGTISDLASCIRNAELAGGAKLAKLLNDGVEAFAYGVNPTVAESLRERFDMPDNDLGRENAVRVTGLLLINAMMLHEQLATSHPKLRKKLRTLAQRVRDQSRKGAVQTLLAQDWDAIRAVDYAPVIDPAIELLAEYGSHDPAPLLAAAQAAQHCTPLLKAGLLDYAGPVYHGLLESRFDGSFYTKTSTATLLADLALPLDWVDDWSDWTQLRTKRICDPACGTGTLLMAAQAIILERAEEAGMGASDLTQLQRSMIERGLVGLDINAHAIHLAACMLTLAAGNAEYRKMALHRLHHGTNEKGMTRCGSLELLVGNALVLPGLGLEDQGAQQTGSGELSIQAADAAPPDSMHLIIMNPPYTRNQIRNDQYGAQEQTRLQQRELQVAQDADDAYSAAIDNTALQTYFTPIADSINRQANGTMAMVMPMAVCQGAAASPQRHLLLDRWRILYIITGHDNANLAFSGNTSIHESLIIGRRKSQPHENGPVRFVSLTRNPQSTLEAKNTANAIRQATEGKVACLAGIGTMHTVQQSQLQKQASWCQAAFVNQRLADDYIAHVLNNSELTNLDAVADIGPDPRGLSGTFTNKRTSSYSKCQYHALWDHKSAELTTMAATPNAQLRPMAGRKSQANRLWDRRSRLLLAKRLRTNVVNTMAVLTNVPTLASAFVPVKPIGSGASSIAQAYCTFLNSTAGIIQLLMLRTRALDYPMYSLDSLRTLRVPIGDLTPLTDAYKANSHKELRPMPDLDHDDVRQALDGAVARAVPSLASHLAGWRELIAVEPTVHGKKEHREIDEDLLRIVGASRQ